MLQRCIPLLSEMLCFSSCLFKATPIVSYKTLYFTKLYFKQDWDAFFRIILRTFLGMVRGLTDVSNNCLELCTSVPSLRALAQRLTSVIHISHTNSTSPKHTSTSNPNTSAHWQEHNGCLKHPAATGLRPPDLRPLHVNSNSTGMGRQLPTNKHLFVSDCY